MRRRSLVAEHQREAIPAVSLPVVWVPEAAAELEEAANHYAEIRPELVSGAKEIRADQSFWSSAYGSAVS